MSESRPPFGQPDIVRFSDEDASFKLLELSLAWQLLQVRKLYNTPLILVGKMWAELVDWGRRAMLREGSELANPVDFSIPHCVSTIEETVALIRRHRDEWLRAQAATKG